MDLGIGDIIVDNDKRMGQRRLRVVEVGDTHIRACLWRDPDPPRRTFRIRKDRVKDHFRSSGFTRVSIDAAREERCSTK